MRKNKVEMYNEIREFVKDNKDYVTFIDAEVARIQARADKVGEKRAEKAAEKGNAYMGAILNTLREAERPLTLGELAGGIELEDVTPGRVAYYAGKLVKDGKVNRDKVKVDNRKITVYALA